MIQTEQRSTLASLLAAGATARSTEIAERIHEQVPEFERHAAVTRQTTDAVRALIAAFARKLLRDSADDRVEMPAEATEYVRAFVRRGFDLELLLRVHHLGHRELWGLSAELLESSGRTDEQHAVNAALFDFMAVLLQGVVEEFEAERKRWIRSSQALRAEIVRDIVGGRPIAIQDASARLRYDLAGSHVALVAWSTKDGSNAEDSAPERYARALTAQLQRPSLVIAAGRRTAFAWIALGEDPGSQPARLLAEGGHFAEVTVAIGEPGTGIEGFRNSHSDAVAALRVAAIAGKRPGSVVRWAELATIGLLCADLDHARRFSSRELGPLDDDDDTTARLRSTLAVHLQEDDRRRTARRLGVHPNTVAYRLRQCEELLGRPIGARRFELELALRLRDQARLSLAVPPPQPPSGPWSELP